jgi:hypothetical protein
MKADEDKCKFIIADKINYLKSDYYKELNRLTEENQSKDFKIYGEDKPAISKHKDPKIYLSEK